MRLQSELLVIVSMLITLCSGFSVVPRHNHRHNPISQQPHVRQSDSWSYQQKSAARPFSRTIYSSSLFVASGVNQDDTNNNASPDDSLRDRLRKLTGFSLTALRATTRAATGISLTAVYASTLAATGAVVRKTMAYCLSIFPTWFRYFLQPFLVMYYMPLFILRNLTGPTRKKARETHEHFVEGWKQAVKAAEEAQEDGYWPVHVNDEGNIVTALPPEPDNKKSNMDIVNGIAESVEVVMEERYEKLKDEKP